MAEAARLLVLQGRRAQGRRRREAAEVKQAAAMAKLYATESAVTGDPDATQVFGGYGFMEEYPVTRFYRDAKILEIGEGTSRGPAHADRPRPRPAGRVTDRRDPRVADVTRRGCGRAREATAAPTREGGRQAGRAEQALRPRPDRAAVRRGQLRRGRPAANALAAGLPADGVVTGRGAGRRPPGAGGRERPDRQGRLVGRPDGREDRPHHRGRAARRAADLLADRLRRRADHRPGRAVPRPPRRRAGSSTTRSRCPGKVPQICCLFGPSAAGGAYIPSFCDIVIMVEGNASMYLGSPADGRDGGRREGDAGGDGRRPDARHRLRLRRPAGRRRRRRDRAGPAVLLLPAAELARRSRRRTTPAAPPALDCRDLVPARRERGRSTSTT